METVRQFLFLPLDLFEFIKANVVYIKLGMWLDNYIRFDSILSNLAIKVVNGIVKCNQTAATAYLMG